MVHKILATTYIDSAELLHEHDEEGRLSGSTISRTDEELLDQGFALLHFILDFEQLVDVVNITGSLKL